MSGDPIDDYMAEVGHEGATAEQLGRLAGFRPMSNRLPVGPGSRGGSWHDPAFRRAYHRAWRASHPDYREREALRRARERARAKGDPAGNVIAGPRSLPLSAVHCVCECGCREHVVVVCGWCRDGMHGEQEAAS